MSHDSIRDLTGLSWRRRPSRFAPSAENPATPYSPLLVLSPTHTPSPWLGNRIQLPCSWAEGESATDRFSPWISRVRTPAFISNSGQVDSLYSCCGLEHYWATIRCLNTSHPFSYSLLVRKRCCANIEHVSPTRSASNPRNPNQSFTLINFNFQSGIRPRSGSNNVCLWRDDLSSC